MHTAKVIISEQNRIANKYVFENEVGLSTYDLTLISINKIANNSKKFINDFSEITYLI